jgi:hypothetical protein
MQALNSTVDIAGMMTGLASSITNFMRQSSNRGSSPNIIATGIALKTETYVSVRWPWIALPVAVLLLSTIFLFTTMIRASKERIPVRKSSSLAMVFHLTSDDIGVAQPPFRDGMSLYRIIEMKGVAETTRHECDGGRMENGI